MLYTHSYFVENTFPSFQCSGFQQNKSTKNSKGRIPRIVMTNWVQTGEANPLEHGKREEKHERYLHELKKPEVYYK